MLDNQEENPVEAFKKLINSQETLAYKSPASSEACTNIPSYVFAELFQQLKSKLVDMDLIQTIENNPATIFEIKGFLSKLNIPEAPEYIVNFVLDFEPFLKQIAQVVNPIKESVSNFNRQTEAMLNLY